MVKFNWKQLYIRCAAAVQCVCGRTEPPKIKHILYDYLCELDPRAELIKADDESFEKDIK